MPSFNSIISYRYVHSYVDFLSIYYILIERALMNQAYEQIARQVVCLYKNLYQGTAVRQYTSYGMYMMRASLPKLTYYNTYEP